MTREEARGEGNLTNERSAGEAREVCADSNDFSVFIFSALMPSAQQPIGSAQDFDALDAPQQVGSACAFIISAHWQSGIV